MHEDQETDPHPVEPTPVPEPDAAPEPGPSPDDDEPLTDGEMVVRDNIHGAIKNVIAEAQVVLEGHNKLKAQDCLITAQTFFDRAIQLDGIK